MVSTKGLSARGGRQGKPKSREDFSKEAVLNRAEMTRWPPCCKSRRDAQTVRESPHLV